MSDKIEVKVNIPSYEYDIHSLVKAFYPKAEVSVQVKEAFETSSSHTPGLRTCLFSKISNAEAHARYDVHP